MEQLMEILREVRQDVDFDTCTTLIDDDILDSFDIIAIVTEINEVFDIQIDADELLPENFNSAENIYKLIQTLQAEDN
ncbi:MAG: acyl carrier protein [Eubacterium sp.]|nr:acyl carrier protein [Eubacterium sp.]